MDAIGNLLLCGNELRGHERRITAVIYALKQNNPFDSLLREHIAIQSIHAAIRAQQTVTRDAGIQNTDFRATLLRKQSICQNKWPSVIGEIYGTRAITHIPIGDRI